MSASRRRRVARDRHVDALQHRLSAAALSRIVAAPPLELLLAALTAEEDPLSVDLGGESGVGVLELIVLPPARSFLPKLALTPRVAVH
jgi:hypothetical protein